MRRFVIISLFFAIVIYATGAFADSASEDCSGRIECMDFDVGTPPANFGQPCSGVSWQGWGPRTYDCSYGAGGFSTDIYYSAPRSWRMTKPANQAEVWSINYAWGTQGNAANPDKIHIRFYAYFDAGWRNFGVYGAPGDGDNAHFVYLNSALRGQHTLFDITTHIDKVRSYRPEYPCWGCNCYNGANLTKEVSWT